MANSITRRKFITATTCSLALSSCSLWRQPPMRFAVLNDLHYMDPESGAFLERAVLKLKLEQDISFCVLAGDISDHGSLGELSAVRDIFGNLNCPVYQIIGNHDFSEGDSSQNYDEIFPNKRNYAKSIGDWQFLFLDTTDGLKPFKTVISKATFDWVDAQLKILDPYKPTIVFTHFPLAHNFPQLNFKPLNARDLVTRLQRLNLQHVFSGHYHGATEVYDQAVDFVTGRCCALRRNNVDGTKQKGFLVCTVGMRLEGEGAYVIRKDFVEVV